MNITRFTKFGILGVVLIWVTLLFIGCTPEMINAMQNPGMTGNQAANRSGAQTGGQPQLPGTANVAANPAANPSGAQAGMGGGMTGGMANPSTNPSLAQAGSAGSQGPHPQGTLDLSALPGCAGACHTNGGFAIDKTTGKKLMAAQPQAPICSTRDACGPVFCQKVKTCCDAQSNCTTQNIGNPFAPQ